VKKQLEAWLKIDSTSAVATQRLAQCLVHQKDVAGGLEELKKAAKLEPKMLTPEAILAQWCEQSGDHESAKKYMALALKAAPKDPRTLLIAGEWAFETGQLDEAQVQAIAAMKLDDKSLDAKMLRGTIAFFQRDYATAERILEDAHLQAPDDFRTGNILALALLAQNTPTKNRQALAYAEANARKFQQSPQAAATYGWALYKTGQPEEADRALRTAISAGTISPDLAYYLAQISFDRKKQSDAKALLDALLEQVKKATPATP
jgi:Tfp pilus assembly protein PilF